MADLDLSPENLRSNFAQLCTQSDKLLAKLNPLWAELSTLVDGTAELPLAAAQARERTLREQIRKLQEERAPVEKQRAQLARLLRDPETGLAKTGELPAGLDALRDAATDD